MSDMVKVNELTIEVTKFKQANTEIQTRFDKTNSELRELKKCHKDVQSQKLDLLEKIQDIQQKMDRDRQLYEKCKEEFDFIKIENSTLKAQQNAIDPESKARLILKSDHEFLLAALKELKRLKKGG